MTSRLISQVTNQRAVFAGRSDRKRAVWDADRVRGNATEREPILTATNKKHPLTETLDRHKLQW